MEDIDIVFHCAAKKHVELCEYNIDEAISTNILGTQNIRDAAFYNNVEKVVFISTDKAVYPESLMGMTKGIGERIIKNANEGKGNKRTIFSAVRFGNVKGSRGSVLLKWEKTAPEGYIEVTDPEMTRYMMSIEDAVSLVFKAAEMMQGGEIFILKMREYKLGDLADQFIAGRPIEKRIIGLRMGERMHEQLMTEEEKTVAVEKDDMWILPGVL
jgi:FlaA1/EpsC-like NDP-sugar epimerase